MNWAEQTEPELVEVDRALGLDPRLRRLTAIMTARSRFAGRRGPVLATVAALVTSAALLVLGLTLITPSGAGITALLAGSLVAGGIMFAAVNAVLDPNAVPPVREDASR